MAEVKTTAQSLGLAPQSFGWWLERSRGWRDDVEPAPAPPGSPARNAVCSISLRTGSAIGHHSPPGLIASYGAEPGGPRRNAKAGRGQGGTLSQTTKPDDRPPSVGGPEARAEAADDLALRGWRLSAKAGTWSSPSRGLGSLGLGAARGGLAGRAGRDLGGWVCSPRSPRDPWPRRAAGDDLRRVGPVQHRFAPLGSFSTRRNANSSTCSTEGPRWARRGDRPHRRRTADRRLASARARLEGSIGPASSVRLAPGRSCGLKPAWRTVTDGSLTARPYARLCDLPESVSVPEGERLRPVFGSARTGARHGRGAVAPGEPVPGPRRDGSVRWPPGGRHSMRTRPARALGAARRSQGDRGAASSASTIKERGRFPVPGRGVRKATARAETHQQLKALATGAEQRRGGRTVTRL